MPWEHIPYDDNAQVLTLLSRKETMGVLPLLDDESAMQSGTDANFVQKLRTAHATHAHLSFPRSGARTAFTVRHYAGDVTYEAVGMREKNRDALHPDLCSLMAMAERSPFVQRLFAAPAALTHPPSRLDGGALKRSGSATVAGRSGAERKTLASQFVSQLGELMRSIAATATHYVRCVKPSAAGGALVFEAQYVAAQLRCAGVLEAVRIARMAFPNRMAHAAVLQRFALLGLPAIAAQADAAVVAESSATEGPATDAAVEDISTEGSSSVATASRPADPQRAACAALLRGLFRPSPLADVRDGAAAGGDDSGDSPAQEWAQRPPFVLGLTKVFFRFGALEGLERRRASELGRRATALQRAARRHARQVRYDRWRAAAWRLQAALRRHRAYVRYTTCRRWAVVQQAFWRGVRDRRATRRALAARRLQAHMRMRQSSRSFDVLRCAAAVAQRWRRGCAARRLVAAERDERARAKDFEYQLNELRRKLEAESSASAQLLAAQQQSLEGEMTKLKQDASAAKANLEASEKERARLSSDSEASILSLRMELSALKKALAATQAQLASVTESQMHTAIVTAIPPPSALPDEASQTLPAPPPPPSVASAPQPLWVRTQTSGGTSASCASVASALATRPSSPQGRKSFTTMPPAAQEQRSSIELLRLLHASEREREQLRRQRDSHADEARRQTSAALAARHEASCLRAELARLGHASNVPKAHAPTYRPAPTNPLARPVVRPPQPPPPPPPPPTTTTTAASTSDEVVVSPPAAPLLPMGAVPQPALSAGAQHTPVKRPGSILRLGGHSPPSGGSHAPPARPPIGLVSPPTATAANTATIAAAFGTGAVPRLAVAAAAEAARATSGIQLPSQPPQQAAAGAAVSDAPPLTTRTALWNVRLCPEGGMVGAACTSSDGRQLWSACTDAAAAWQLRLWSVDTANGRLVRSMPLASSAEVDVLLAHAGHLYVATRNGIMYRYAELGTGPPQAFDLRLDSAPACLEIEVAARAGWAADGTTARGRPALLLCGARSGHVCAVELPLRSGGGATARSPTIVENTFAMQDAAEGVGTAGTARDADAVAGMAVLAAFTLPGGLPGAAARAAMGGGSAGIVHLWSLRDGAGCGTRLGSVRVGSAVLTLLPLGRSGHALAGLGSGTLVVLAAGGADGSGGAGADLAAAGSWSVLQKIERAHQGPIQMLKTFPADSATAAGALDHYAVASTGNDRAVRTWHCDTQISGSGGFHAIATEHHTLTGSGLCALLSTAARSGALVAAATDGSVTTLTTAGPAGTPAAASSGAMPPPAAATGHMLRAAPPAVVHRGVPGAAVRRTPGAVQVQAQASTGGDQPPQQPGGRDLWGSPLARVHGNR